MSAALFLRNRRCAVQLLPHLGGAIGSFAVDGRHVLRPTPDGATSPLDTACFAMVPFANRIAAGRFRFAGASYALPPNAPGFVHPLHGLGWLKAWTVAASGTTSATLGCSHDADEDWPWSWSAVQRFELADAGLLVSLELANTGAVPMPGGLGLHPYFVRRAEDMLAFEAAGVWDNDAGMIPQRPLPAGALGDFGPGQVPNPDALIDNCYFGWDGRATWGAGPGQVALQARDARFLHVFAPVGEDFICLEPTSQMPDAVNRADFAAAGGKVLMPGARLTLTLGLEVTA